VRYLIKNGRVIDPANSIDDTLDIIISDGKVDRVGKNLNDKADETIDAANKIVAPGLVDMHAHLREPGREDEETIRTGTRAAIRGGYTSVACMPNTDPAIDNAKIAATVKEIAKKDALCNVFIIGAITEGRGGKRIANFREMKREGLVAFSDDGSSIEDREVLREALEEAKKNRILIIEHCEDAKLSAGGVINKGFISTKMGLRGMPGASEYEIVNRDIAIAKKASSPIHIAHVSCKESVEAIRKAKREGLPITCETAPHYFTLTEDCCASYDTNTKMNPPLRTKDDVEAIKNGLRDGAIDVIATDHAPHTDAEKDVEFDFAPFGIIGLETALSLAAMELVDTKVLSWAGLIAKMSSNPARILGLDRGNLKKGSVADLVIIDPPNEYIYKKEAIESKSKNSPFIDWKLKGKAVSVFVNGTIVMRDKLIR